MAVGVQRQVTGYERVQAFDAPEPTWFAELICGHKAKLAAEPAASPGKSQGGRYIDCEDCTRLAEAQS